MKKKLLVNILIILLIGTITPVGGYSNDGTIYTDDMPHSYIFLSDALQPPDILDIQNSMSTSPIPGFYETSEYMIGSVAVGVIFLESNGGTDTSTEDWTTTEENTVKNEIQAALNWWASQNSNAGISFVYDWNYQIPTSLEPITHPSVFTNNSWEQTYVSEAMAYLGYTTGDWIYRTRDYINDLRTNKGTDWAFAVYIIDSSADADGCFSDASPPTYLPCAWAYKGIFASMTYDNGKLSAGGWGINRMDQVMAHETGHIFWATDEYQIPGEYSGYLNGLETDYSGCIMDTNTLCVSSGTKKQIGWQDTDMDTIQDIIDTNPDTTLNPYTPDPTYNTILTYTGSSTVMPYTNNNPDPSNTGNDVTINTISNVQYRIDGGTWINAQASDGSFDNHVEAYTFTTTSLSPGSHTIEARAINSVNNIDTSPASDTVTILVNTNPNTPSQPSGPTSGTTGASYTYSTSTTDPDNDNVKYGWDWDGDNVVDEWTSFFSSGSPIVLSHTWNNPGTYQVQVKAEDINGAQSSFSLPLTVVISGPSNQNPNTPSQPSGPTSGTTGASYTYSTSTTDPDNDNVKYGWDFNNDGIVESTHWTSFLPSGATCSINVVFYGAGTYDISVIAEDIHGAQSSFSLPLTVVISGSNSNPNTPSQPSGPTSGNTGTSYTYSTSTIDPDNDNVKYGWDWDGDNVVDEWTDYTSSGSSVSMDHTWTNPGIYQIKVKSEDEHGAISTWSSSLTVVISGENNPPNNPTTSYDTGNDELIVSATDPDGDQIRYGISWDNDMNVDEWTDYVDSGTEQRIDCNGRKGTVGVIAEDLYGAQSEWMSQKSKNKIITPFLLQILENLLQNHPYLLQLIQQFLGI